MNIAALRALASGKDRGLSAKGKTAGPVRTMIKGLASGSAIFILAGMPNVPTYQGSNDKGKPKFSEGWEKFETAYRSLAGNTLNKDTGKRPYGYNEINPAIARRFAFDVARVNLPVETLEEYRSAGVRFWDANRNVFLTDSEVDTLFDSEGADLRGGLFCRIDTDTPDLSQGPDEPDTNTSEDSEVDSLEGSASADSDTVA